MAGWLLGKWAPDASPRLNDGVLTEVTGAYPTQDGYRPVGSWEKAYSAVPSRPLGAASFTAPGGDTAILVGTSSAILRANVSGGFTQLMGGYSVTGTNRWRFAQFGGIAVATNGTSALQKINLSTNAVADLAGAPPVFSIVAVVKDFLVGGVKDGDVQTFAWSGINNAEFWTFGENQSDFNVMPSGGAINGILSGEFGVILQRNRISRMDYVGGNVVFEINEVSSSVGCVSPQTVAQWGNLGFFWSDEGPMMWDGNAAVPIGNETVSRFITSTYREDSWPLMTASVDPNNTVVMWTVGDRILMYNWILDRWAAVAYASPLIFSGQPDTNSVSPIGLPPRLFVFSSDFELGALVGANQAAAFGGPDLELFPGRRADISRCRVETDARDGFSVRVTREEVLGEHLDSPVFTDIRPNADVPMRISARFIRPTIIIAAGTGWTYVRGAEFSAVPSGRR